MNAYHVISEIQSLVHIKNAFITLYNYVALTREHLALYQLKKLNHI